MTPALRGHAAMLFFSALVAGSFSLGSMAANEIAPAALNAVRFILAGAVIGAAMMATTGVPAGAFRAPWRYAVLGGLFSIYFVLMFEGLKTAPPVSAAAVFTLTPVVAAGFGWLLLRQITTPRMAVALCIGAAGALWVIFRADVAALRAFEIGRGEVIYFFGCVAHALYTPMVRKLNRGEPAVVFTFGMLVAGAVLLTLWGWRDLVATPWASLPGIVWITIVYTAFFASSATFVLLQYATLRLPSAKVMAYTYLTPSWVIGWEIALGNGAPGFVVAGGVLLTILALALLLRDDEKTVREPQSVSTS
ncbi:DMT family transporter [Roseobacter sp.]|uniref:DMT family transporter n=1 Tax=Roseobacter sp. TaxID=1907202 RepID=UPI0025F70052|nr:DMT family transporter [Roseobacter sp.]